MQVRDAFHSTKNAENFETGTNGTEIFLGKFPENLEIVEFLKSKPFNQKSHRKIKWNRNSQQEIIF